MKSRVVTQGSSDQKNGDKLGYPWSPSCPQELETALRFRYPSRPSWPRTSSWSTGDLQLQVPNPSIARLQIQWSRGQCLVGGWQLSAKIVVRIEAGRLMGRYHWFWSARRPSSTYSQVSGLRIIKYIESGNLLLEPHVWKRRAVSTNLMSFESAEWMLVSAHALDWEIWAASILEAFLIFNTVYRLSGVTYNELPNFMLPELHL